MKSKKVPLRMCVACREKMPKKQLIRIVKTKENGILVDVTGKVSGKGAYICKETECLEKVQKTKFLSKFFEQEVPDKVYKDLEEAIKFEKS
ncbi:MAG: YlxR family protein [Clostridia bacterium]|nr:YlxR family protein [Clostridia bacterium]